MYCSQRGCYNEMIPDHENTFDLCQEHWEEYKKKKEESKIDYSKHQTLAKNLPKKDA